MTRAEKRADIIVGLLMLALAALMGIGGALIPASVFDPIGSGKFPVYLSLGLSLLSIAVLARAVIAARIDTDRPTPGGGRTAVARGAMVGVLVVAYCLAISLSPIPFEISTTAFIPMLGTVILAKSPGPIDLVRLIALGILVAIIVKYVFTEILYLSLP